MWRFFCCFLFSIVCCSENPENITGISQLPPPFQMDNFLDCPLDDQQFCHVKIRLESLDNNTKLWCEILETKTDPQRFSRDVLYRSWCFPKGDPKAIQETTRKYLKKTVGNLGLQGEITKIYCEESPSVDGLDLGVLLFFGLYIAFIAYATLMDYLDPNAKLRWFSVLFNWHKLVQCQKNPEHQQLKFLNGFKTFGMVLVVFLHCLIMPTFVYIKDVIFLEMIVTNYFYQFVFSFGMHMIQTFFLISAWLTMLHVKRIITSEGNFTIKHVVIMVIIRYLRFIPVMVVMLLLYSTSCVQYLKATPYGHIIKMHKLNCRSRWWTSLLYINNQFVIGDMCNSITWYLSTDMQMFTGSLLILHLLHKYHRLNLKWLGGVCVAFATMHFGILYIYEEMFFIMNKPDIFFIYNILENYDLIVLYFSSISNISAYFIGLIFGYLWYSNEKKYHDRKLAKLIWVVLFVGLPVLTLHISIWKYSRFAAALIGVLLRPMFITGIAVGILGMTQNFGGSFRRLFEHKYIEILSKLTFSTYIFHFGIVIKQHFGQMEPVDVQKDLLMFKNFLAIFEAFIIGLVVHLLFEQPWLNVLQSVRKSVLNGRESKKM